MAGEKLIPLSALQHYAFCPRQCALIHNEQVWAENWLTAQGQVLHQRVDRGEPETRKGVRFERGVQVSAETLGLIGKLDLVEVEIATGAMKPVEYKRGKPKTDNWDKVQLTAQAFCLEEMTGKPVTAGALWYWQIRRREEVAITHQLRTETRDIVNLVRKLLTGGQTPKAKYEKKCRSCSLMDLCNPQILGNDRSDSYVSRLFDDGEGG